MLMGPMKESKEDSVDLKGITADAMEHIIEFIYSGEMELDFYNLYEILNAASHLQVYNIQGHHWRPTLVYNTLYTCILYIHVYYQ